MKAWPAPAQPEVAAEPAPAPSASTIEAGPLPPPLRAPHPAPLRIHAAPRDPGTAPRNGGDSQHGPNGDEATLDRGATAPQLRRFIKSRAYVPMHELRRRFAINGGDDEVTTIELNRQRVYVGLPEREGRLLGDLLRGGDIGYELSLDPISPIVVGVYPMRPVTRA